MPALSQIEAWEAWKEYIGVTRNKRELMYK